MFEHVSPATLIIITYHGEIIAVRFQCGPFVGEGVALDAESPSENTKIT